jgi:hypothetical protein
MSKSKLEELEMRLCKAQPLTYAMHASALPFSCAYPEKIFNNLQKRIVSRGN